ncbi:MAG: response regulator [Deltaproteobacteria bacterium]|nr:response regulator [Deltaproteobacteria bacterium]
MEKVILIVDDEEDVQTLLQKRLSNAGFRCVSCTTVEAALGSLRAVRPHLIILDLGFKKASGIAFLQNMWRYLPAATRPPVMVLSAYGDPEIANYAKSLGAETFVSKPFDAAHLLHTIHSVLQ